MYLNLMILYLIECSFYHTHQFPINVKKHGIKRLTWFPKKKALQGAQESKS